MLKQISASGENKYVVDIAFDKIEEFLRQANEIGLITDYQNYLFTSLASIIVSHQQYTVF